MAARVCAASFKHSVVALRRISWRFYPHEMHSTDLLPVQRFMHGGRMQVVKVWFLLQPSFNSNLAARSALEERRMLMAGRKKPGCNDKVWNMLV